MKSTYHLHIVQNALRRAARHHLRANEIDERRFGFANVLDDLLVDPRSDFLLHQCVVDLRPVEHEIEQIALRDRNPIDNRLDLAALLLLRACLVQFALRLVQLCRIAAAASLLPGRSVSILFGVRSGDGVVGRRGFRAARLVWWCAGRFWTAG